MTQSAAPSLSLTATVPSSTSTRQLPGVGDVEAVAGRQAARALGAVRGPRGQLLEELAGGLAASEVGPPPAAGSDGRTRTRRREQEREDDAERRPERRRKHGGLEVDRVRDGAKRDGRDAAEADREADRESRGHADTAGHVLLAHDEADAERADHGHAREEERDDADRTADEHVDERSAAATTMKLPSSTRRRPTRSASGPPISVPSAPAKRKSASSRVP